MPIFDPSIYLLILLAGAFIAAFVTGAVGFADGLILNAFWLHIMEPSAAIPLVIISGLLIHIIPLYKLRKTLDFSRLKPFVLFGVIGVPLGMWALTRQPRAMPGTAIRRRKCRRRDCRCARSPVSYTHLTLPTICSV